MIWDAIKIGSQMTEYTEPTVMFAAQTLFEWAEELLVEEDPDIEMAAEIYTAALDLEQLLIDGV